MSTNAFGAGATQPWASYVVDAPRAVVAEQPATHEVSVERGLRIPMRDGIELAAVLWRPADGGPYPVLVERGPHRLEERTGPAGAYHGARGIAVLSVGLRGCSGSGGEFSGPIPGTPAGDGYDTVEWTAAQPWCNGRVGMICGSISGFTQYQTAVEAPPHLVPLLVREGLYSLADDDQRGMFALLSRQFVSVSWTQHQLEHYSPELRAKAEASVERWRQEFQQARQAEAEGSPFAPVPDMARRLPLYPDPDFAGVAGYYNEWIAGMNRPGWADEIDPDRRAHQTRVPVCHLGGWFDGLLHGVLRAFTTMQARAATPAARAGQRLIVGPWVHGPDQTHGGPVGLLQFGPNAGLNFMAFRQRWYDAHLSGQGDLAGDPVVWLYLMGPDRWLGFENWPPPITATPWYLDGAGLATTPPESSQTPDRYEYDPADPVRTLAGGGFMGMGVDQRPNEHRLLTYTSPPLDAPLTLTGPLKSVLYAASSAPDTDWIVRLTLVRPDGASVILSGGALRARYRHSLDRPEFLQPDRPERFEVEMMPVSIEVPAGHALRLTVTSSDFPAFDRNLNTGGPIGREAAGQVAVNRIYHDADHPSHVVLPVLRAAGTA